MYEFVYLMTILVGQTCECATGEDTDHSCRRRTRDLHVSHV